MSMATSELGPHPPPANERKVREAGDFADWGHHFRDFRVLDSLNRSSFGFLEYSNLVKCFWPSPFFVSANLLPGNFVE